VKTAQRGRWRLRRRNMGRGKGSVSKEFSCEKWILRWERRKRKGRWWKATTFMDELTRASPQGGDDSSMLKGVTGMEEPIRGDPRAV